jgi:hypothetical protein
MTMKPQMSFRSLVVVVVVLGSLLGVAGRSQAATGVLQIVIAGALSSPTGTSGDGQITLRVGVNLPVSFVNAGAIVPGSIGTATVARWTDTMPSTGFGPIADLMVFRLGEGVMVVAGGITTPSGFVTTFSATEPFETLSGTWTMTGGTGSGVAGAGAGDAVVTFTFDTNPSNTISGAVRFVADGLLASILTKPIQGLATVGVLRNIPIHSDNNDDVGPRIGTLASYSAYNLAGYSSEFIELSAINFGGVYVLYACAFPQLPGGIACLVGGAGPVGHLSGQMSETAAVNTTFGGVDDADLVLRLVGSLP